MEDILLSIVNKIPIIKPGQRIVIGIVGLSRSGKTTLALKIKYHFQEKNISVHLFHIDDFVVERKRRYKTKYDEWYEYYHLQRNVEWLKENFFQKLKESNELQLQTYDYSSDTQKLQVTKLPETCIILIEGVFLQRKEWRNFYDFIIYLESSREDRFKRESMETQTKIEKFKNRYWKAEDYYIKTETPTIWADLIIRN